MDFAGRFGFSVKFVSYFVWGGISGSFLYPLSCDNPKAKTEIFMFLALSFFSV